MPWIGRKIWNGNNITVSKFSRPYNSWHSHERECSTPILAIVFKIITRVFAVSTVPVVRDNKLRQKLPKATQLVPKHSKPLDSQLAPCSPSLSQHPGPLHRPVRQPSDPGTQYTALIRPTNRFDHWTSFWNALTRAEPCSYIFPNPRHWWGLN